MLPLIHFFLKEKKDPAINNGAYENFKRLNDRLIDQKAKILESQNTTLYRDTTRAALKRIEDTLAKNCFKQKHTNTLFSIKFLLNDPDTLSGNELRISLLNGISDLLLKKQIRTNF